MEWLEWIPQYGFPIVMCLILMKQNADQRTDHKKETAELTKVIENNSLIVQKMVDKIESLEGKLHEDRS